MFRLAQVGRYPAKYLLQQACFSTSSTTHLIINAVGRDRLGIVSDITGMVISHGGNVGDSQAVKLGSHFSLMMMVSIPDAEVDELKTTLASMGDMNAAVYEADSASADHRTPSIGYSGHFSLEGADNPGIVHKITSSLAKHGLSIDKMETDQEIAPHGGTTLFKMQGTANAQAPLAAGFDIQKIKDELVALGDSLNCDADLEDAIDESAQSEFSVG